MKKTILSLMLVSSSIFAMEGKRLLGNIWEKCDKEF